METIGLEQSAIYLQQSDNGYYAISNGIYYKVNEKTYSLLKKVISGESYDNIAETFRIEKAEIENLLNTFKQKKEMKSAKLLHFIYPRVNNAIGCIFSHLFNKTILLCLSTLSIIALAFHFSNRGMGLIYSDITIWHYIVISLVITLWHEFGHVSAAYRKNIKDLNTYIGTFFIFPIFYVQLDQIYTLKHKDRLLINYGGVYFQLILSLVLFISNILYPSDILRLSINMNAILAAYNLLPVMITDGYWIYSDSFQIDNLNKKANLIIKRIVSFKSLSQIDFKIIPTILCYSVWKLIVIALLNTYIVWFLYKRSYHISDMYYLLIESHGDPFVIMRCLFLICPYLLLIVFLYKKTRSFQKTRQPLP
jgi:putative peptide zinc metalloprotease protein